ncbi:MAG: hypothetical protein K1X79_06065 [Oligoflexia bacterium]|nr:hypothetical protein [Oligoflexia bacterium]
MAVSSSSVRVPSSKSNLLATLIVVGVVFALFFIPEIIGYQKSHDRVAQRFQSVPGTEQVLNETEAVRLPDVGPSAIQAERSAQVQEPPLAAISRIMEEGRASLKPEVPSETADPEAVAKCVAATIKDTPEKKAEKVLSEVPLTFDKIKSQDAKYLLNKARGDALTLLTTIPKTSVDTRFALYGYVSALGAVLANPEEFGEATDAIAYVERMDQTVTRAMFRERVDRSDYLKWASISLGDELRVSRNARTKSQYRMPFNPRFTISSVEIRQPAGLGGGFDEKAPVYINFEGFVVGKDVTKFEIYHDDKLVSDAAPLDPDALTNRRMFSYTLGDGRGTYTFKVYDDQGNQFVRSYAFYPKVRSYPWKADTGLYTLPFKNEGERIDMRLDRTFRATGNDKGSSNSGIGTF